MSKQRVAVVLMNMGGPDSLSAVQPFLYNLFADPAIIQLPGPFRQMLAWIISRTRASKARKIFDKIGGSSPLLSNTQAQQAALENLLLQANPDVETKVFIAMRYWHPLTEQTVAEAKAFQPDKVILLPLYPQYSLTTTGSSFLEWEHQAQKQKLEIPTWKIQDYAQDPFFIEAHADLIRPRIEEARAYGKPRLFFSAHGLPQKIIDQGDPYEKQIHQTVERILEKLSFAGESVICYQSKVGPLKWLTPSTEDELRRAGEDGVPVVVIPVAFVSEHSETLVELDKDYRELAKHYKIPFYGRVPALGTHPAYMQALAKLVTEAMESLQEAVP